MRETVKQTEDWDSPVSPELQNKWLKEFIKLQKNAVNNKIRLIRLGDAIKSTLLLEYMVDSNYLTEHFPAASSLEEVC